MPQENLTKQDPYFIERMDRQRARSSSTATRRAAWARCLPGVTVVAWYPITPSTSLIEATTDLLKKFRVTPEGKATFAVVQAEDELAAIGMVLGAGWAGARAMTVNLRPGHLADGGVCRAGLLRRDSRRHLRRAAHRAVHGHAHAHLAGRSALARPFSPTATPSMSILLPGSVKECFELGYAAFDLAERLQTPVFVLTDLDLGMNNWMSEPFDYPAKPLDRGKVLTAEDLERLGGFARYRDVDGDAIGWRTLPGTAAPQGRLFHARLGTQRRGRIYRKAGRVCGGDGAAGAQVRERAQAGSGAGDGEGRGIEDRLPGLRHHRLRAAREPGPDREGVRPEAGLHAHPRLSVRARDSRLCGLRTSASTWWNRTATRNWRACSSSIFPPTRSAKLRSILHYNGLPLDARTITEEFATKEGL